MDGGFLGPAWRGTATREQRFSLSQHLDRHHLDAELPGNGPPGPPGSSRAMDDQDMLADLGGTAETLQNP